MPVDNDAPPAEALETADAGDGDGALRVLIVDYSETNRKVLELILDQVGADWVSVEDGKQAVEAARDQVFTALLMDIQTPVMDGLSATREIRRSKRRQAGPRRPWSSCRPAASPSTSKPVTAPEPKRHLGKPVGAQALLEALNEVLADTTQAA